MNDKGATKGTNENISTLKGADELLFDKDDQIRLLKILFRYGYPDFPLNSFPNIPVEKVHEAMKAMLDKLHVLFKSTPSLVHWLHGGLFRNTESIPMALLFIEWYEQHPSQEDDQECNFRDIYHFLYKLTMNQVPTTPITEHSAKVLYTIITEVLHEAWLDKQQEILAYCSEVFKYRRTLHRRVYRGKRKISEEEYDI